MVWTGAMNTEKKKGQMLKPVSTRSIGCLTVQSNNAVQPPREAMELRYRRGTGTGSGGAKMKPFPEPRYLCGITKAQEKLEKPKIFTIKCCSPAPCQDPACAPLPWPPGGLSGCFSMSKQHRWETEAQRATPCSGLWSHRGGYSG